MGFTSCDVHALDLLAEVIGGHIEKGAADATRFASAACRAEINIFDVMRVLKIYTSTSAAAMQSAAGAESGDPNRMDSHPANQKIITCVSFAQMCQSSTTVLGSYPRELPSLPVSALRFGIKGPASKDSSSESKADGPQKKQSPYIARALERLSLLPATEKDVQIGHVCGPSDAQQGRQQSMLLKGHTENNNQPQAPRSKLAAAIIEASGFESSGSPMGDPHNQMPDDRQQRSMPSPSNQPPPSWSEGPGLALTDLLRIMGGVHLADESFLAATTADFACRRHQLQSAEHGGNLGGGGLGSTDEQPSWVHPHMPKLPPKHTYCRSAMWPSDDDKVHIDVAKRRLQRLDNLEVQVQLPDVMMGLKHVADDVMAPLVPADVEMTPITTTKDATGSQSEKRRSVKTSASVPPTDEGCGSASVGTGPKTTTGDEVLNQAVDVPAQSGAPVCSEKL
eukprot:Selendium_serpulae@DN3625_c0_g1_i1.p1